MSSAAEALEVATTAIVPKGFRVLVQMPEPKAKTAGGLFVPDKTKDRESTASMVGQVIAMGEDAYQDLERFAHGPWCAVGDWVVFRSYAGTPLKCRGREYRLINDDTVEAVTFRPEELEKP